MRLGKPEVPENVTLAKGPHLKIESDIYGICLMKKSVDVKLCTASCLLLLLFTQTGRVFDWSRAM